MISLLTSASILLEVVDHVGGRDYLQWQVRRASRVERQHDAVWSAAVTTPR